MSTCWIVSKLPSPMRWKMVIFHDRVIVTSSIIVYGLFFFSGAVFSFAAFGFRCSRRRSCVLSRPHPPGVNAFLSSCKVLLLSHTRPIPSLHMHDDWNLVGWAGLGMNCTDLSVESSFYTFTFSTSRNNKHIRIFTRGRLSFVTYI